MEKWKCDNCGNEVVKCTFCGSNVEEAMAIREDNSIIRGSCGAVHSGHSYPLCPECHKVWTDLIGCLIDKFKAGGLGEALKEGLRVDIPIR